MIKNLGLILLFLTVGLGWAQQSHATVGINSITISQSSSSSGNSIVTFMADVVFGVAVTYQGSVDLKIDGVLQETVLAVPATGTTASFTFSTVNLNEGTHTIEVTFTGAGAITGVNATSTITVVTTFSADEIRQRNAQMSQFIVIQAIIQQYRSLANYAKIQRERYQNSKQYRDNLQSKFVGDEPGYLIAQNDGVLSNSAPDAAMPMISKSADLGQTKLWFVLNNSQYKNNNYNGQGTATNVSNGGAVGFTKILTDRIQGGAYIGYGTDQFKVGSSNSKTDITTGNFGAFVNIETSAGIETNIAAIYSNNKYDYQAATVKGSADGSQLAVVVDVKGSIKAGQWTFSPSVGFDTVGAYINSYKDSASVNYSSESVRTSNVNVAGQAAYRIESGEYVYTPSIGLVAANHHSTARITDTGELGAMSGLDLAARDWAGKLGVSYTGLNSDYKTWSFLVGVAVPF